MEDRRLVADFIASRSEEAFLRLYRAHTPGLYRIARRVAGREAHEAEDLLQATWIRAAAGLAGFAWQSSLRTWLTGILLHCAREASRRSTRTAGGEPATSDIEDGRATPSHSERLDLERAVAALPEGYREILVLHDIEGYTHGEIAALLGITEGTSKSQLSHARDAVRRRLGWHRAAKTGEEAPTHDKPII
jgi:RNA polymerase sigma-70 factor, ECF subfamily